MLAFTLSRRDFREYDQITSFYTKDQGKVEAVARGVKKSVAKNAPSLEPFSLLEIELVPGRGVTYVTKVFAVEHFAALRGDLPRITLGGAALAAVERSAEPGEKDEAVFDLLHQYLRFLHANDLPSQLLAEAFIVRLWGAYGFAPVFDRCIVCGSSTQQAMFFEVAGGGLVCEACGGRQRGKPINSLVSSAGQLLLRGTWDQVQELKLSVPDEAQVLTLTKEFVEYHSGRKALSIRSILT